jgi:hypothetical protein
MRRRAGCGEYVCGVRACSVHPARARLSLAAA